MFKKRYVALAIFIFLLGVIFAIVFGSTMFSSCALFAVSLVVGITFSVIASQKKIISVAKKIMAAAFAVAFFSLGAVRVAFYDDVSAEVKKYDGMTDECIIEVIEFDADSIDAQILYSDIGVPDGVKLRFYSSSKVEDLLVGDKISAEVKYNYRNKPAYLAKDFSMTASGEITEIIKGDGFFYSIRKSVAQNSEKLYEDFDNAAAISKGVTIGDRSEISSYLFSIYKSSGLSHVLAISGLHISIITFSFFHVMAMFIKSMRVRSVLAIVVAFMFTALVGFTPGAVRSAVMISLVLTARMFILSGDSITMFFISLLVILLYNPYAICGAGLQLSYLCTFGILLIEPMIEEITSKFTFRKRIMTLRMHLIRKFFGMIIIPMIISFVSSVFSFPVLFASFDTVSYISPITNIFAVPLFSYAVELALVAFIVAAISVPFAMIFAYPAGCLFDIVTDMSRWLYDMDFGIISVHVEWMIVPFLISLFIIASLVFVTHKRTRIFVISSMAFCVTLCLGAVCHYFITSDVITFEYGSNGSEYVFVSDDGGAYVDLGGYTANPKVVLENGMTSVEDYIIVEYNDYAVKRFDYLSGNIKVSNVYLPYTESGNNVTLLKIKELANERNCDIIFYNEYFSKKISENSTLMIFGKDNNFAEDTLVCVDVGDKKIRVLDNGFSNAVNCDVAVVTKQFGGEYTDVLSGEIYTANDYAFTHPDLTHENVFAERICIEIDTEESDYTVYEP